MSIGRIFRRALPRNIFETLLGPDPMRLITSEKKIGGDVAVPPEEVPEVPEVPGLLDAERIADKRAQAEFLARGRRRRGRAASVLTGPQGAGLPGVAAKILLGE